MKKLKEQESVGILKNLKNQIGSQMGSSGVLNMDGGPQSYVEFVSEIPEQSDIIKKPKKNIS